MECSPLFKQIKTPSLYEKSSAPFWDDEHISKGMLEAHLDPDLDAASRPMRFIDESAEWIAKTFPAREYPSLLDLGCGPGLYAERFCKAGYCVTGVDLSLRSIDYAKQKAEERGLRIRYHHADYLSLDLRAQFDLATMIYCDYGALSKEDRREVLKRVHLHLRSGGMFLLDVSSVSAFGRFEEGDSWDVCENGGYWSEKPHLAIERKQRFAENVTLHEAHILTETARKTYYIWHTYFTPESLRKEAERAGFALRAYWGDVKGTPYTETSPTIAAVLERV